MSERSDLAVSSPMLRSPPSQMSTAVVDVTGAGNTAGSGTVDRHGAGADPRGDPLHPRVGTRRGSPAPPRPPGSAARRSSPRSSRRPWSASRRRRLPRSGHPPTGGSPRPGTPGPSSVRDGSPGWRARASASAVTRSGGIAGRLGHVGRPQERERVEHVGLGGHRTHRPARRGAGVRPPAAPRNTGSFCSTDEVEQPGASPRVVHATEEPGLEEAPYLLIGEAGARAPGASGCGPRTRAPPRRRATGVHPAVSRSPPDGFFAYAATPDCRSAPSFGQGADDRRGVRRTRYGRSRPRPSTTSVGVVDVVRGRLRHEGRSGRRRLHQLIGRGGRGGQDAPRDREHRDEPHEGSKSHLRSSCRLGSVLLTHPQPRARPAVDRTRTRNAGSLMGGTGVTRRGTKDVRPG